MSQSARVMRVLAAILCRCQSVIGIAQQLAQQGSYLLLTPVVFLRTAERVPREMAAAQHIDGAEVAELWYSTKV